MSDNRAAASLLITQILSLRSPELGARLKQRLKQAFASSGLGVFDEKSLGFSKFTDYLLHEHGDIVKIVRQEGSNDIHVFLRGAPSGSSLQGQTSAAQQANSSVIVRSDIWQAFVNPDPERRRFYSKESERIVHFIVGKNSPEEAEVESSAGNFVEIFPISGDVQIGWMRDFIANWPIPDDEKEPLNAIASDQYTSAVHATFIRALGARSAAWRNYRTPRVVEIIEQWAKKTGVPTSIVHVSPKDPVPTSAREAATVEYQAVGEMTGSSSSTDRLSAKQQVVKLLDLLTEDDVSRLVLPTLLSTILIKSRL